MNIQQIITRSPLYLMALLGLTLFATPVAAQVFDTGPSTSALFDNVINVPADGNLPFFSGIGGDGLTTQLNLSAGGDIGFFFDANAGGEVNISGGNMGSGFNANSGSEVNISGDSIGGMFNANSGSLVNISGGSISTLVAESGSLLNISGGIIDLQLDPLLGSEVNISGGVINGLFSRPGSEVNISGGTFDPTSFFPFGGNFNLFGSDFFLDDVSLDDILTTDEAFTIDDRDVVLTSVLADGSSFSLDLFTSGTEFNLTVTLVSSIPEPGSLTLLGLGGVVLLVRRRKNSVPEHRLRCQA